MYSTFVWIESYYLYKDIFKISNMTIRLIIISILLSFPLFGLRTEAQTSKQQAINLFLQSPGLEYASVGLCVKDFSGNIVAQHNMNKSLTPASTLKVITTATALEVLGADFQYKTQLAKDKNQPNRLLIIGSGDPTLGSEHTNNNQYSFIQTWTDAISKVMKNAEGSEILVIDNTFGYGGVSRKWIHEDLGNYYAAGAYGISVYDNTYRLTFNTENNNAAPKILETKPQMKDIIFNNTLKLNTTGKDNGYILGEPFSNQRTIIGDIPANRKRFTIKGDIPNPGLFLGNTIADQLRLNGFKISTIKTTYTDYHEHMYSANRTTYNGSVFYEHTSPTLTQIIRIINEKSNNHYSEHLIRTLGRAKNKDIYSLALEEGIDKIKEEWTKRGLKTNALFMYDGCGLAPNNAVSSKLMTDILTYMQTDSKNSHSFLNSLPLAGREGTVRNFLKGTRLEGKVYVKSGSIANVQCYSGYYLDGDKKYAFTIMVNNYHGNRSQVVKAIEKLLLGVLK